MCTAVVIHVNDLEKIMKTKQLKKEYLNYLAVQGYAEGTIRYRSIYIEQFLKYKSQQRFKEIDRELIYRYQLHLNKKSFAPLTISSKLSVLCCFLSWMYEQGELFSDISKQICFPKRQLNIPKDILTESEVKYFLSLPDINTRRGIRDRAILELLYSTAIRRRELVSLELYDINWSDQVIRIHGKRDRERLVPVGSTAICWLDKYVTDVRSKQQTDYHTLFLDLVCNSSLSVQRVNMLLGEYLSQSTLQKNITPHSFRHTCATHLLRHGADIRYIQAMLGHASPETTQIYTHVEISDLQAVYRKTHPRACKK